MRTTTVNAALTLQLMIMEAMRLSLIDHEEHQKNIHETSKDKGRSSGAATPSSINAGESSTAGASGRNRADTVSSVKSAKSQSGASKLFQKLGGRSRSGSLAKVLGQSGDDRTSERRVSFATAGGSGSGTATGSNSPRRSMDRQSITGSSGPAASTTSLNGTAPSATSTSPISTTSIAPSPLNASTTPSTLLGRSPPSSLTPAGGQPVGPITTLASHSSGQPAFAAATGNSDQAEGSTAASGLPRLSLDMPALTPDAPRKSGEVSRKSLDLSRKSIERPRPNQDDDDAQRPLLDEE